MILYDQTTKRDFLDIAGNPDCRMHFSQFGECCLLTEVLFTGVREGFYVDVGCHDPFRYSNTYLLWKMLGWRGVNVDADPRAIEKFNAHRPNDVNLNLGVGAAAGELEFQMFDDGAVNTFDANFARHMTKIGFGEPTRKKVPVRPINDILAQHLPPGRRIDYLNIDCEGTDFEIVSSYDFQSYPPKAITIELGGVDLSRAGENKTVALLREKGFRLYSFMHVTGLFLGPEL